MSQNPANQYSPEKPGMIVILNARSGTAARFKDLEPRIAELFRAVGLNAEIISVAGKDVNAAAKQAVSGHHETIVAAGGDGTVSAVAAEVAGTKKKVLGVLPLGTLNHFAKDLHLPLNLEGAVRTIAERNITTVDVGEVNGRVFINNSSLGIYPHIVHRRIVEQMRLRIGKWPAFIWASMRAFRRFPFLDLRIEVKGTELRRETPFLFVGNNEYEMTGFRIGARKRLDAGKLGLYLTRRVGRWGLIRLAVRALLGQLSQQKDFEAYMVDEAFVEAHRRLILVAADGEVRWMELPLQYRSRPGALRVIAPRNHAR
jgi:diacylglycerol kinase family enzyme